MFWDWLLAIVISFHYNPEVIQRVSWCECVKRAQTDHECDVCDRRHDPDQVLSYTKACGSTYLESQ